MKHISFISFLLCLTMVIMSACSRNTSGNTSSEPEPSSVSSEVATAGVLTLPYCSSDVYNPYSTTTKVNQQLSQLLYDPLIKLNENLSPVYVLAESVEINGKHCAITIKNTVFSDGTAVTADDIVYSIKKAIESTTKYRAQLSSIISYSAASSTSVTIMLSKSDPYFVNMLDFPIIKRHTDGLKDENNIDIPPIGSGRYTIDLVQKLLIANPNYYGGVAKIGQIKLLNTPDDEALQHDIEVGSISCYFSDLSDCVIPKMTGSNTTVNLNNLVYMGINMNNPTLKIPEVRYALSCALNRTKIANQCYFTYASAATGPFNSVWKEAANTQSIGIVENIAVAVADLAKIGYNIKDTQGFYMTTANKRLSFTLLVNSNNSCRVSAAEQIKAQLAAAGIEINIKSVDWDSYLAALTAGNFDLYLGEIKIPNNMDLSELVTPGSSIAYGVVAPDKIPTTSSDATGTTSSNTQSSASSTNNVIKYNSTSEALTAFYNNEATISDVILAFNAEMPIIPICHRSGIFIYSTNFEVGPSCILSDVFHNIENCTFK
ncbi:MAG: ABC transporter substrate-binding protein [Oscillospiraceae bacterium]|nr:ABC transporter substrate-binding protein [Oscillospiraceae bacterium]